MPEPEQNPLDATATTPLTPATPSVTPGTPTTPVSPASPASAAASPVGPPGTAASGSDETVRTSVRTEIRTENPAPAPAPIPVPAPVVTKGPRTRTMVYGLILLVIAVCVLVAQLTSIHLDAGAVALTVMVIAGLLLIAGGRRNSS